MVPVVAALLLRKSRSGYSFVFVCLFVQVCVFLARVYCVACECVWLRVCTYVKRREDH